MTAAEKKVSMACAVIVALVILYAFLVLNARVDAMRTKLTELEAWVGDVEASAPAVLIVEDQSSSAQKPDPIVEPEPEPVLDLYEVELIGRTIWGEAMGVRSKAERAAVAWCILNRADAWGESIEAVVTAPRQFHGYRWWGECPQEHLDLAADVLTRWHAEREGEEDVGRTLPAEYLYFYGDGVRNHFSKEYKSRIYWDWSLTDPYIEEEI